jgi:hypothetical protein
MTIKIKAEKTEGGRWHFRATNAPDFFKLGPNHARSVKTWASKRSAIRAGLREFIGAEAL